MKTLDKKLIIYDSNCSVCSSLREVTLRLTPIPKSAIVAYKDLSRELETRVDPGRFKNGMALLDTDGGETLYGAAGVAYIFSSQYRIADVLLRNSLISGLFIFFYKTLAYNRYNIVTPKSSFDCDCFPDKIVAYRLSFIILAFASAAILTALFGVTLVKFIPGLSPGRAAAEMILIAGTGWAVQLVMAMAVMKNRALDYAGHIGTMMVLGLTVLVPWMIFQSITGPGIVWMPVVSVVLSSGIMLYVHIHRVRYLGLSQWWTVSWFVSLQTTASAWIYFFHVY